MLLLELVFGTKTNTDKTHGGTVDFGNNHDLDILVDITNNCEVRANLFLGALKTKLAQYTLLGDELTNSILAHVIRCHGGQAGSRQ